MEMGSQHFASPNLHWGNSQATPCTGTLSVSEVFNFLQPPIREVKNKPYYKYRK